MAGVVAETPVLRRVDGESSVLELAAPSAAALLPESAAPTAAASVNPIRDAGSPSPKLRAELEPKAPDGVPWLREEGGGAPRVPGGVGESEFSPDITNPARLCVLVGAGNSPTSR